MMTHRRSRLRDFARYCVSDRDGNVVIGQRANLPIKVFVIAAVITFVLPGTVKPVTAVIAAGSLFTWAWLELFDGTTPLRRVIGGVTLVFVVTMTVVFLRALPV